METVGQDTKGGSLILRKILLGIVAALNLYFAWNIQLKTGFGNHDAVFWGIKYSPSYKPVQYWSTSIIATVLGFSCLWSLFLKKGAAMTWIEKLRILYVEWLYEGRKTGWRRGMDKADVKEWIIDDIMDVLNKIFKK